MAQIAKWRFQSWLSILLVVTLGTVAFAQDIRVVFAGRSSTEIEQSIWRGVKLGEKEANILGRYTGQTYTVEQIQPEALIKATLENPPTAIVAAGTVEELRQLSAIYSPLNVAVFNVSSGDDDLRAACLPGLLHVPPSERMLADAIVQWKQKNPEDEVEAWAWHADFKKFAARDLNKRFHKMHQVPMDNPAWAGWAALKMISETVARMQSAEPAKVLAYLRDEIEFDGQKGWPHTFRDTGQLRQPLLMVIGGKLAGEAPVRGVADTSDLDSLGLPSCKK